LIVLNVDILDKEVVIYILELFSSIKICCIGRTLLLFNEDNDDSSSASFDDEFELCRRFIVDDKFGTFVVDEDPRINGRNVL